MGLIMSVVWNSIAMRSFIHVGLLRRVIISGQLRTGTDKGNPTV